MITYKEFKEIAEKTFKNYLPEKYKNAELKFSSVQKVNRVMDGMTLMVDGEGPTIYINDMYDYYAKYGNLQETLKAAAGAYERCLNETRKPVLNITNVKDNVIFQFVNTEQNRELLGKIPHREFFDLSIIYRFVMNVDEETIESGILSNNLMETLELNEGQLYELASKNTRRILPICVKPINDILCKALIKEGGSAEVSSNIFGLPENYMYVISNLNMIGGAVSILYEDILYSLAQQLEDDLYILPSSIHEVIAIPVSGSEPNKLSEMVTEINMSTLSLKDRLSNQVYRYDKNLRKLSMASDTPLQKIG